MLSQLMEVQTGSYYGLTITCLSFPCNCDFNFNDYHPGPGLPAAYKPANHLEDFAQGFAGFIEGPANLTRRVYTPDQFNARLRFLNWLLSKY